jgi:hypothetical protein
MARGLQDREVGLDVPALKKNHGKYVSCVTKAANDLRDQGLISEDEKGQITAETRGCGGLPRTRVRWVTPSFL